MIVLEERTGVERLTAGREDSSAGLMSGILAGGRLRLRLRLRLRTRQCVDFAGGLRRV